MNMNFKTLIAIFGAAAILLSCGEPPVQEAIVGDASNGEALFQANCTVCHQADGKGKAGFAPSLNNIDFLAIADDHLIKQFILEGRAGTTMIPFKNNPDVANNINDLVVYMRSWSKDFPLYKEILLDKRWESDGDASNGEALFANYCAACHGDQGQGYSAKGSGTGIGNPAFLALVPDDYIKQTLLLGRAGTAMKPFDGAKGVANLSDEEMNDVVSFLRTKGEYIEVTATDSLSSSQTSEADFNILLDPYYLIVVVMLVFFAFVLFYIMIIVLQLKKMLIKDKG